MPAWALFPHLPVAGSFYQSSLRTNGNPSEAFWKVFVCLFKLKAGTGRAPPHPRRLRTPILFRFPHVVATRHCPPWGLYPVCLCRKRTLSKFQGNDPRSPALSLPHHRASHSASWSQGPLAPPASSQSPLPGGFS